MLLLLEAPGPKATTERGGSGFVSPDNNDGTAENMWRLLREAEIDRSADVVTWNVVPWYIGTDEKVRAAAERDLKAGRRYIKELIDLLPRLRVVVLIGKKALSAWKNADIDLPTIEAPHPSPQNLNTRPHLRAELLQALTLATKAVTDGRSDVG